MLDGTAGVLVSLAVNPNVALPDGGSRLFQSAFLIVASDPAADMVPFHELDTVSSLASTQLTVQPNSVDVVGLVTVTWPWKPPGQVFVIEYVAVHGVSTGGGAVAPMPVTSPLPPSNTTSE